MKTALITGICGQDGVYLADLLVEQNYRLIGAVRDPASAEKELPCALLDKVELVDWDMRSQATMIGALTKHSPDEIYNFAAFTSGEGMFEDAPAIGDINGVAISRMLDAIRKVDPAIRFCQASSSEMFGEATESPQHEETPFKPRSPYGAAKLYAHNMVSIYRRNYNLFACSAILFNHESKRRGLGFVTRKITHEVAKIKLGLASELSLGNLEARRDWGFAGDYVLAMWKALQQPQADDYVISTGTTHSVRELCEIAFTHVGLNYENHVKEDANAFRPGERFELVGDSSKARSILDWAPSRGFRELITDMVDADIEALTSTVKK